MVLGWGRGKSGVEAYLQYVHGDLSWSWASAGKIAVAAGAGAATGGVSALLEAAGASTVATIGTTAFYGQTATATAYAINSCAIDRNCSPTGLAIAAMAGLLDAGGGGAAADLAEKLASRLGTTSGAVAKGAVDSTASAGIAVGADQINAEAQGKPR